MNTSRPDDAKGMFQSLCKAFESFTTLSPFQPDVLRLKMLSAWRLIRCLMYLEKCFVTYYFSYFLVWQTNIQIEPENLTKKLDKHVFDIFVAICHLDMFLENWVEIKGLQLWSWITEIHYRIEHRAHQIEDPDLELIFPGNQQEVESIEENWIKIVFNLPQSLHEMSWLSYKLNIFKLWIVTGACEL